jgi:excisionase family DNA binding protein
MRSSTACATPDDPDRAGSYARDPQLMSGRCRKLRKAYDAFRRVSMHRAHEGPGRPESPRRPEGPDHRERTPYCTTMEPRSLTRSLLSTTEVAELLGIPRSTVHHLARRGELPARPVGRRWLFLRERIAAAIAPLDDPSAWRSQNDATRL